DRIDPRDTRPCPHRRRASALPRGCRARHRRAVRARADRGGVRRAPGARTDPGAAPRRRGARRQDARARRPAGRQRGRPGRPRDARAHALGVHGPPDRLRGRGGGSCRLSLQGRRPARDHRRHPRGAPRRHRARARGPGRRGSGGALPLARRRAVADPARAAGARDDRRRAVGAGDRPAVVPEPGHHQAASAEPLREARRLRPCGGRRRGHASRSARV
ncbi:MAG: Two-component transcriptional response regulator, LuxR family, partial [uncultured Solirubrobacteraceae bacterium]